MTKEKYKEIPDLDNSTSTLDEHQLLLINDDIHTFDFATIHPSKPLNVL
jgi:hypothetical protein